MSFWKFTKKFEEVENPVWNRFKKSNGIIEAYCFLRFLLERGKYHPAAAFSMMGEYALVMLAFKLCGYHNNFLHCYDIS